MKCYYYALVSLLSLSLLISSCSNSASAGAGTVREGRVITISRQIETADRGLGRDVGGILGSLAGLVIGNGTGRYVASAGGAIGGQIAGGQVAKKVVIGENLYYRIQFPAGDIITIVREATAAQARYAVGQKVRVVSTGRDYRILLKNTQ